MFKKTPRAKEKGSFPGIIVECEGKREVLSKEDLEKRCSFSYNPHLKFLRKSHFFLIRNKIAESIQKGLLDPRYFWFGLYFQQEILSDRLPPVFLKWIDPQIGWGVFAQRNLSPMEYIGEYSGILFKRRKKEKRNKYVFSLGPICGDEPFLYLIDAEKEGGLTRFINHSSNSNLSPIMAIVDNLPHIILFVKDPIKKGEQLLYDYGPGYWKKGANPQELNK